MFGTGVTADTRRHSADETCARDEDILAQQWECQCGVRGVAKGIHDGSKVVRYLRAQLHYVGLGDRHVLGKSTVAGDTHGEGVLADVPHATTAVAAVTADDMPLGSNTVADLDITYAGTYLSHYAYELMSLYIRRFAVRLRPFVPLVHVEVGAADSGFGDLDEDIVQSDFGHRDVFHPDAVFGISFY